jgi:hypothetical protein
MRFPAFDLPTAAGPRLTNADLAGRPTFAYMARHPGCYVCQHKLADALGHRQELRAMGGDIVLFFNADVDYVRRWVEHSVDKGDIPADLTVAMDPDARLYEEVGTIRGSLLDQALHAGGSLWRARKHIRKWRLSSNDMLRMGADVAISPGGEIALRHICQDPEDRAAPDDVLVALRATITA